MTGEDSFEDNDWSRYLFSAELAEMLPNLELGASLGEDKGVTQLIAQHKQKKQGYSNKVFLRMLSKTSASSRPRSQLELVEYPNEHNWCIRFRD